MKRLTALAVVGGLVLAGCASNDEALACRDRKLQERACENESLMRQNDVAAATRSLLGLDTAARVP